MKYVVTGHTSGIGKELFNKLHPNVKGYSLSSGFDINNKQQRTSIIQRNLDADVFINCAEDKFEIKQVKTRGKRNLKKNFIIDKN